MNNFKALRNTFGEQGFLPIIPLRGIVPFPNTVINLEIGRKKTSSGINFAMRSNQFVFLVLQKDFMSQEVNENTLYSVGTIAKIKQVLRIHGDEMRVSMEVFARGVIDGPIRDIGYEAAQIQMIEEAEMTDDYDEVRALIRKTQESFKKMTDVMDRLSPDVPVYVNSARDGGALADYIAQNINFRFEDKQILLEIFDPIERLYSLITLMESETEMLMIERKINIKVNSRLSRNQHEYLIREQIRALQEELGEDDYYGDEDEDYFDQISKLPMPEDTREKLLKEVSRLMKMPQGSQEASVMRLYLDACVTLPWGVYTKDTLSIEKAEKVLNADHYGLKKVKERILETLSVRKLSEDSAAKAQILCLVGPPGTGKTSIAMSIAKALNRKFARISLGGVHDEAEIRGHRRTYIGSMPGKIISALKETKTSNPLILLDEIDKLGSDYKGDPSSALLEVLDPEQNKTFKDNFLDIPYDLSDVLFITTANVAENIPQPLYDRMDVIELSSYTAEEKFQIAKRHLLPKQLKKHGFTKKMLSVKDSALRDIISYYTREAGVRTLERTIASICRKAAKQWLDMPDDMKEPISVTSKNLAEYLGPRKFKPEMIAAKPQVGVVTGLAYTSVGGETMPIEVNVMEGNGKIELTGSLGDVMKESAHAAVSFIRANAEKYGVDKEFYKNKDIHIHVPEGAVPKDGPSAGITMATALLSQLSGKAVRNDVAMTGEITIRGRVLPIGGLREKTMAAYKAGVKTIIIPEENLPDLYEVEQVVKDNVEFVSVSTLDEVIKTAFAAEV